MTTVVLVSAAIFLCGGPSPLRAQYTPFQPPGPPTLGTATTNQGTLPLSPPEAALPDPSMPVDPSAPPNVGPRQLVVDVIVRGAADEDRVLNSVRTKKEFEFDPMTLQADVRRLMTSNQFENVRTYTKQVAEGIVVIFEVRERPRINYIYFHGNRGFSDKKLGKTITLKLKSPLNAYEVEEGRRAIEELYHSKGYPKAQVGILEGDKPTDKGVNYLINEGYLQRISSVSFEGNTFVSDGVLKTKIESKPGYLWVFIHGKLSREKLDSDVEKLTTYYHDFGYFRARVGREVTFDESGRWATVKFVIDEGQRYNVRNVSIVGNQKFRTDPLVEAMTLKADKPFTRGEMQKDLTLLRDLYGSQGHIFADVQVNPRFLEEPGKVDLVYKIQEGEPFHVGEINVHIAGEFPHTRRNVVLNRLSMRPGDLIDIRQVRDSERRLKFSQLFETEQTGGDPPRIVIRPPELAKSSLASTSGASGPRGQSPEVYRLPPPTYDLDVYVPALNETGHEAPPEMYRLPPVETMSEGGY